MADTGDVKLRSVCDACTAAKLRCNGKVPCERCLKKGIECHYQPFKHRGAGGGGHGSSKAKNNKALDASDNFLDEYERKTWSVFFTLYKSFGKGCSIFWFKQQLFKMLHFLENRSQIQEDIGTVNALARLKSWMTALGIDVSAPPVCSRTLPHLQFTLTNPPNFQTTLDDLRADAKRRNLPMFTISNEGIIEVNDAFVQAFDHPRQSLQRVLDEAGGGFLPWSGDILARLLARESDLVLYLQAVSNTMDAIGKPLGVPSVQVIPSMNVLKAVKRNGQETLCIVRAVQQLHLKPDDFTHTSTVVLELSEHPQLVQGQPTSIRTRPFSETSMAANDTAALEHESKKLLETEPDDILPLPQDILTNPADEEWLDALLNWAAEEPSNDQGLSVLPLADDMLGLNIQHGQQEVL